jgi:hypothetical protein
MATQSYIISAENRIVELDSIVQETAKAFRAECQSDPLCHPYPENRDCWGTLWLNALTLRNSLESLLSALDKEFK